FFFEKIGDAEELFDKAIGVLRTMEEEGTCMPNLVVYGTVINGLCKDKMVDEALQLLSEMIEKGIGPDVITWEAEEMVQIMLEGCESPNVFIYNALMVGYCLQGDMNIAAAILDIMMARGCPPSSYCYSILINGYCKKEMIDDVLALFHEISRKGLEPTLVTYNTMLQGLYLVGRCADAKEPFKEMQTHTKLISGLCKNGFIAEALPNLSRMENSSVINLDITTYNAVIDGLCRDGKFDDAKDLFNKLPSRGKTSWPELLGVNGNIAVAIIEKEFPWLNAKIVPKDFLVPQDFRFDRVWIWVDNNNIVFEVPRIG
ncbi:hypothetical protein ACH5RR_033076, partial [Cinchona calisaya]